MAIITILYSMGRRLRHRKAADKNIGSDMKNSLVNVLQAKWCGL